MFPKKAKLCFFSLMFLSCEIFGAQVATKWVQVGKKKIGEEQACRELQGISNRHYGSLRTLFGSFARRAAADAAELGQVHINLENPKDPRRDYKSVKVYQAGDQVCIRFIQNRRDVAAFNLNKHSVFRSGAFDLDYPDKPATPVVCDKSGAVHIYLQNAQQQIVRYTLQEKVVLQPNAEQKQ